MIVVQMEIKFRLDLNNKWIQAATNVNRQEQECCHQGQKSIQIKGSCGKSKQKISIFSSTAFNENLTKNLK